MASSTKNIKIQFLPICFVITSLTIGRIDSLLLDSRFAIVKWCMWGLFGVPGQLKSQTCTIQTSNLRLTQKEAWEPPEETCHTWKNTVGRENTPWLETADKAAALSRRWLSLMALLPTRTAPPTPPARCMLAGACLYIGGIVLLCNVGIGPLGTIFVKNNIFF